jgi:hypothetical protein
MQEQAYQMKEAWKNLSRRMLSSETRTRTTKAKSQKLTSRDDHEGSSAIGAICT